MVTMAAEVHQTHREDHHEVHPHGVQDGRRKVIISQSAALAPDHLFFYHIQNFLYNP